MSEQKKELGARDKSAAKVTIEKSTVLQEARLFNQSGVTAVQCVQVLFKMLMLIYMGEKFTNQEATDFFFATTKLFQHQDRATRRLVYLVIKEIAPMASDVVIVTASLTKDMTNSQEPLFRANALRALMAITEPSMIPSIERYIKQTMVDKSPHVASAALVSAAHLLKTCPDVVRRWLSEISDAVNNQNDMVQYHALGLLASMKSSDRLALLRTVSGLTSRSGTRIQSKYGHIVLIRAVRTVVDNNPNVTNLKDLTDYLERCLSSAHDMVVLESARVMCALKHATPASVAPAITVLRMFLSSPHETTVCAAIRTIAKVGERFPAILALCNKEMETLMSHKNRIVAAHATATLLKTGDASLLDRLLAHVITMLSDAREDIRIMFGVAIKQAATRLPDRHASMLREEGGIEFKETLTDVLMTIAQNPAVKDKAMVWMCEYIEDCEFVSIHQRVLHFLGREGPKSSNPLKFVRHVYNRVMLENPAVRAAAISSLVRFGVFNDTLRPLIATLLRRSLHDVDDDVRDRAMFGLRTLESASVKTAVMDDSDTISGVSVDALHVYLLDMQEKDPEGSMPFNIEDIPRLTEAESRALLVQTAKKTEDQQEKTEDTGFDALLGSIVQFKKYGKLLKSSPPVALTESETEYVVTCHKHVFLDHLVLQYNVTNTMKDQLLKNVTIATEYGTEGFEQAVVVPLPSLAFGQTAAAYVSYSRSNLEVDTITNTMKFMVHDVDASTGEADDQGYADEYALEDLEICTSDYANQWMPADFDKEWNNLEHEVVDAFALGNMKTIADATRAIVDFLGMTPVEGAKPLSNAIQHTLKMSASFLNDQKTLVVAVLAIVNGTVTLKMTVRSSSEVVAASVAGALA